MEKCTTVQIPPVLESIKMTLKTCDSPIKFDKWGKVYSLWGGLAGGGIEQKRKKDSWTWTTVWWLQGNGEGVEGGQMVMEKIP